MEVIKRIIFNPEYAIPNIIGTLEDISDDDEGSHIDDDFGSTYTFELDYFNMTVL